MALQLGALRDALESAQGVPPELARKAAEEVAGYEQRFTTLEQKIDALDRRVEKRFDEFERKVDQRFAAVDQRFAEAERRMDQRFAAVDVRLATLDGKIDKLFWAISTIGALTLLTLGKIWFG